MISTDYTGIRYGKLVGVFRTENAKFSHAAWLWQCDCGEKKVISADSVKRGLTTSCGCVQKASRVKHGHYGSRTYSAWVNMKARVKGNSEISKRRYFMRGITVCARWQKFENFLIDMGECPVGLTLERKNNDKGYSLDNCVWATQQQQSANTCRTHKVICSGVQMSLAEACRATGLHYRTAMARIARGQTPQDAFVK